jgi:FkbM family methyltransferase
MIQANSKDNVICSNIAISDKNEKVFIETRANHAENRIVTGGVTNKKGGNGVFIQSVSLDDFVKTNNIEKINFLKMNIEGAELHAIKGMTESIKKIDHIAIACHDFFVEGSTEIKNAVTAFLEENNFKFICVPATGHIVYDSWVYASKQVHKKVK